jgi:hypothetical protein
MYFFVYYKLDPAQYPDLKSLLTAMQENLVQQFPGLSCNLLKRPKSDDQGYETWMESYHLTGIDATEFSARLERLTQDPRFPSPRRNERFISQS